MKKFFIFLLLFCFSLFCLVQAKEVLTVEQRIQNYCNKKIEKYNIDPTVDNEIIATECIYNYSKAYKLDIMPIEKQLFYLYADKYQNSAENPKYFDEMYKYGMAALKNGSKDVSIATLMVLQAVIKQNINDIDYTFELLSNIAPQKANEMKADIVKTRKLLQEKKDIQTQQNWENIGNAIGKAFNRSTPTNYYYTNNAIVDNYKTWITSNNSNGKVLLTPEYVIIISDFDTYNTCLWLPMDNILINNGYVINLSSGEKAEIKNINYK